MITCGEYVSAQLEDLLGDLRCHAEAAGGVFDVHYCQVHVVSLAHMTDVLAHDPAPCAAENVADEQDFK